MQSLHARSHKRPYCRSHVCTDRPHDRTDCSPDHCDIFAHVCANLCTDSIYKLTHKQSHGVHHRAHCVYGFAYSVYSFTHCSHRHAHSRTHDKHTICLALGISQLVSHFITNRSSHTVSDCRTHRRANRSPLDISVSFNHNNRPNAVPRGIPNDHTHNSTFGKTVDSVALGIANRISSSVSNKLAYVSPIRRTHGIADSLADSFTNESTNSSSVGNANDGIPNNHTVGSTFGSSHHCVAHVVANPGTICSDNIVAHDPSRVLWSFRSKLSVRF